MVETIVRCPYCVDFERDAFMPMIEGFGGKYVCARCGHAAVPASKAYQCACRRCAARETFTPETARVWWHLSA